MKDTAIWTADSQRAAYDSDLEVLDATKHEWARTGPVERAELLAEIKRCTAEVAEGWAETAARKKRLPQGSPLAGEEWLTGPYSVIAWCDAMRRTLLQAEGKRFLDTLPLRTLPTGQQAVRVFPSTVWDKVLLSGVKAEVWMQPDKDARAQAAAAFDTPATDRTGKVALVLGAGNIAAISPLDAFQKLFVENQVVLLKMNPVNDYLTDYLQAALRPLTERGFLRIHRGDGAAGAYLTTHPLIQEIHITGARATHDAIVWGTGEAGQTNRQAGTPANPRPVTSELGAVCPTIVVPGPWTAADIRYQAEHLATMKLHNSGFNCIAMQALVLPEEWDKTEALLDATRAAIQTVATREAYYPGASDRLAAFAEHADAPERITRSSNAPDCIIADLDRGDTDWLTETEIFAPALGIKSLPAPDAETYLRAAIAWANKTLYGTLGANILIHPATIRQMGRRRFEEILADLRYGVIAVNCWTGLGFSLPQVPWGGFAGATLSDVQSGIGTVHNSFMLEGTERTVIEAPWRPFPRNLLSGDLSLLPRPPWFVTNKRQHAIGRHLTLFQVRPSIFRLFRIFANALRG